jgi:WD40 repeat protein
LKIWSLDTGEIIHDIDCGYWYFSTHFSPDGNYIAGVFEDLVFWKTSNGRFDGDTLGVTQIPLAFAFSHDSKIIAAGNFQGKVQLWKNKTGSRGELRTLSKREKWNDVSEVAFSPDDRFLVAVSCMLSTKKKMPENMKMWEVDTGNLLWSKEGERLDAVAFSPDGKFIVTGGSGAIQVWDIHGNLLRKVLINAQILRKVCILDNGRIIVGAVEKNDIKIWDIDPEV